MIVAAILDPTFRQLLGFCYYQPCLLDQGALIFDGFTVGSNNMSTVESGYKAIAVWKYPL